VINSNLGRISHLFRDIGLTGFLLKTHIFSYRRPFNSEFKNVSLALHYLNFVRREPRHGANYSLQKVFFCDLTLSRNTYVTNRRTDGPSTGEQLLT